MKKIWEEAELISTDICETACIPCYPPCKPTTPVCPSGTNTFEPADKKHGCGGFWFWPWF